MVDAQEVPAMQSFEQPQSVFPRWLTFSVIASFCLVMAWLSVFVGFVG